MGKNNCNTSIPGLPDPIRCYQARPRAQVMKILQSAGRGYILQHTQPCPTLSQRVEEHHQANRKVKYSQPGARDARLKSRRLKPSSRDWTVMLQTFPMVSQQGGASEIP